MPRLLSGLRGKTEEHYFSSDTMGANYIKQLPLRGTARLIEAKVAVGNADAALLWERLIQPHIFALSQKKPRLDAHWNWHRMFVGYELLERASARTLSLMTVSVRSRTARQVPVGQMIISEGYPALDGSGRRSVFIWFLAGVPLDVLIKPGVDCGHPNLVLEALVDTAIQRSDELGYGGLVGLHAAPKGGPALLAMYRDKTRARHLYSGATLGWGRKMFSSDDGRYFMVDTQLAAALTKCMEYLR